MQKRSGVAVLLIAIICGLIGVYLVMNYVGSIETAISEKPMKKVVVASQNIPENVAVTGDMIQVANIPAEFVLPQAYTRTEDVVGSMTTTGLLKGEQILKGRVSKGEDKSGFSYGVPKGKRAMSIGIDQVSGVSGLVGPKDKVDILATLAIPQENAGSVEGQAKATDGKKEVNVEIKISWQEELQFFQKVARKLLEGKRIISYDGKNITFTLFQNIEVLAIGSQVKKPQAAVGDNKGIIPGVNEGGNEEREAKTLTLCLDAEQAELITNAEKVGSLKLDLRNPGDDQIIELKPIMEYKLEDILKDIEKQGTTTSN